MAATTTAEILDETKARNASCWRRICCRCLNRAEERVADNVATMQQMQQQMTEAVPKVMDEKQAGKCMLCLSKMFCCRKTNKIRSSTGQEEEEIRRCCFCIPCRRRVKETKAWTDNRQESILSEQTKQYVFIIQFLSCTFQLLFSF